MQLNIGQDPRMRPMPPNPMDKSTIVSVFPKEVIEVKETIFPGRFHLEAAKDNDFTILVVGPSSWWRQVDPEQPYIEIPTPSLSIAESVVNDYCIGLLACDMSEKMPGLFFLPGAFTKRELMVKPEFKEKMAEARRKQDNWFREIVRLTDMLWAASNGNPRAVSDDARLAAEKLHLNKPWMADTISYEKSPCPACGNLINMAYPVCQFCKTVVNEAKMKELGLKFAS